MAIKGLKDAAYLVYNPLRAGNLADARKYTGYIVGRDTDALHEEELTRAVVETVAENIVDAVIAPLFYRADRRCAARDVIPCIEYAGFDGRLPK